MTKAQSKYRVEHAEYSAIGDYAQVNNYFSSDRVAGDPGMAALRRLFEEVNRRLDSLEDDVREEVQPDVRRAAELSAAIQQGDDSPKKQTFLERRLKNIAAMAPDIAQVIVATLVSPTAGLALTLQKIAQKVQAELEGEGAQA